MTSRALSAGSPTTGGAREPDMKKLRIVVADDSPVTLKALCLFLQRHARLEVVGTAADGAEAVFRAETLLPDLVLTDLEMPVLDGLEAARHIRARFPNTRIVVTSSREDESWREVSRISGADEFVTKRELEVCWIPLVSRLFAERRFRAAC